jgi:hypothetical protein
MSATYGLSGNPIGLAAAGLSAFGAYGLAAARWRRI